MRNSKSKHLKRQSFRAATSRVPKPLHSRKTALGSAGLQAWPVQPHLGLIPGAWCQPQVSTAGDSAAAHNTDLELSKVHGSSQAAHKGFPTQQTNQKAPNLLIYDQKKAFSYNHPSFSGDHWLPQPQTTLTPDGQRDHCGQTHMAAFH